MEALRQNLARLALLGMTMGWAFNSAATSGGVGHVGTPLLVQVDRHANVYVDGVRVDTVVVCRRQWVHWRKREPTDPDLSIQFQRTLIHPRHPVAIRVSNRGKPIALRVDIHARHKTYVGRPGRGFAPGVPKHRAIHIRVVPPRTQ
jgi:hypothetical protein